MVLVSIRFPGERGSKAAVWGLMSFSVAGKNGNKRGGGWAEGERSRSILKNKESRGTDSELLLQETTSLGANVSTECT